MFSTKNDNFLIGNSLDAPTRVSLITAKAETNKQKPVNGVVSLVLLLLLLLLLLPTAKQVIWVFFKLLDGIVSYGWLMFSLEMVFLLVFLIDFSKFCFSKVSSMRTLLQHTGNKADNLQWTFINFLIHLIITIT